jgi:hypothetical protein
MDYANERQATVPGIIVPQAVFSLRQPYERLPDVRFSVNGVRGIRLADALNPRFQLDDAEVVPRLSPQARKITLRVNVRISVFL